MLKLKGKKLLTVIFISAIMLAVLPLSQTGSVNATASSYNCTNATLQTLINRYSGTYWSGSYGGARQCKGFADMMFNAMYGTGGIGPYNSGYHYYIPNPREATEVARTSYASRSDVYNMMHKAISGDYIQWSRGYSQHSAIFVSCDENGFYIFDCNYISSSECGVHYMTYDKLASTNRGVSVYTSNKNAERIAAEKAAAEKAAKEAEAARKAAEEAARIAAIARFDEENIELSFEETATPDTLGTNQIVSWETSDNSVAIVDGKGNVTGVGAGVAVITITDVENNNSYLFVNVKCSTKRMAIEGFLNGFEIHSMAMSAIADEIPEFVEK